MKKVLIFLFIAGVYYWYQHYYVSGKFNVYLEKHPDSEKCQLVEFFIGKLNYWAMRYDSAIFRFERVIDIYSSEKYKPKSYFTIAEIYNKTSKINEAVEMYKFIQQKYPNTYFAEVATKRLELLQSLK